MKEINIAKVLVNKRREKGVTQDELASYIGVSKASVSKWETGQSYPDLTLLPPLAAYFNISIDELIDYQPQMTKEDIHKVYRRFSAEFASKPFDSVLCECRRTVKKYYSCFPLLEQMGLLLINHLELEKDSVKIPALIDEAKTLFSRVRAESDDANLTKQALYMEAYCALAKGDPASVLALLDGAIVPALPPESLLSAAYGMLGRQEDAKAVLQVGIYQDLVVLFNFFPAYLVLISDKPEKFEQALRRALTVADTFDMRHLHPGVLVPLYLAAAQGYLAQGSRESALAMLQKYTDTVTGDIYPLKLHSDAYFDRIDGWLEKLDLGTDLPRDETTVKRSMANTVIQSPVFAPLAGDARFVRITEKLTAFCLGD